MTDKQDDAVFLLTDDIDERAVGMELGVSHYDSMLW